jgi:Zn-dependent peptidase ImmA (M78 family)/transcriptional regulator with XRE-family HTH domain
MSFESKTALEQARVVPERIREAKEGKGLTSEAFAEILNVSRQAVGQYETGKITPSAEVMSRIIAITEQPPSFFTASRSRNAEGFGTPFWRGLKRMNTPDRLRISRRLEWAHDIVLFIERYLVLPETKLPNFEWDWEVDDEDIIESIAEKVRDEWELGRGPVFHLSQVLESNGFILIKEPVKCEEMDAVSRWQDGRPYILCSAEKDALPRYNYDLAHELGHMVLHSGVDVSAENLAKVERQANRFAGAFLMPRESFVREVVATSVDYFLQLKQRWRVSVAAMVMRCRDLEILNKNQVSYLYRQMNARKMRKREPLDNAFKVEEPSLIFSALDLLIQRSVTSKNAVIDSIPLKVEYIESLAGAPSGFLGQNVIQFDFKQK